MRWLFIGLAVLLIQAYLRAKSSKLVVLGKENLPVGPGYILAANHLSYRPLILWARCANDQVWMNRYIPPSFAPC